MISMERCVKGGLYRVRALSFEAPQVAIYAGGGLFIGIREKLGNRFLFTESHVAAPDFATVQPMRLIARAPSHLPICLTIGSRCAVCQRTVYWPGPAPSEWQHIAGPADHIAQPVSIANDALFAYLDNWKREVARRDAITRRKKGGRMASPIKGKGNVGKMVYEYGAPGSLGVIVEECIDQSSLYREQWQYRVQWLSAAREHLPPERWYRQLQSFDELIAETRRKLEGHERRREAALARIAELKGESNRG